MELRHAELEDLPACAALPSAVQSSHVWQLSLTRDPVASLATSEYDIALRCLRLPRPVQVDFPVRELSKVWDEAKAVFVAIEEDVLGGFIVLTAAGEAPVAMISRLVIATDLRRHGIGTALVRTAARWAAAERLTGLSAHCSARNHPAVAFFTHLGFAFAGYNEAFYPRSEIALFWQRRI
jgi:GNAT superfamily N-acetyltransferase